MSDAGGDIHFVFYHYTPSIVAAVIFCILFAVGFAAHLFYVIKLRARYFIPFVIGCILECLGYAGRAWSHSDKTSMSPYIMQSLLILVAPALFAASIYMVLGRIIRLLDAEQHSLIRTKWLTKIFVAGDVFSFFVQASGAGLQATGSLDSFNTGKNVIVAGLIIQILIFGFFVIVTAIFHSRLNKMPTAISTDPNIPWKKHMYNLYFTSAVILLRNVVRVVEYAQGNNGYIISHEFMLYIFDALFIFIVVVAFFVIHPNKLLGLSPFGPVASGEPDLYAMETGNVRTHRHHSKHRRHRTHSDSSRYQHHQQHTRPTGPRSERSNSKHHSERRSKRHSKSHSGRHSEHHRWVSA